MENQKNFGFLDTSVGSLTDAQRKKVFALLEERGVSKEEMESILRVKISDLSKSSASLLIGYLTGGIEKEEAVRKIQDSQGVPYEQRESGHDYSDDGTGKEIQKPHKDKENEQKEVKKETLMQPVESLNAQKSEYGYSREEVELIKTNFAYGATDSELKLFFYIAKTRKLNPLLGEIKWVRRRKYDKEKNEWIKTASIIIGIDGARRKAQESGNLDGVEVSVRKEDGKITYGTATVWLKGSSHPIRAEVPFEEFVARDQNGNPFQLWKTMPETMIKKVAEMTAYRMAFPSQLAGMYIDEEMQQAGMADNQKVEVD
jgi:phage recombination protein Bet